MIAEIWSVQYKKHATLPLFANLYCCMCKTLCKTSHANFYSLLQHVSFNQTLQGQWKYGPKNLTA